MNLTDCLMVEKGFARKYYFPPEIVNLRGYNPEEGLFLCKIFEKCPYGFNGEKGFMGELSGSVCICSLNGKVERNLEKDEEIKTLLAKEKNGPEEITKEHSLMHMLSYLLNSLIQPLKGWKHMKNIEKEGINFEQYPIK